MEKKIIQGFVWESSGHAHIMIVTEDGELYKSYGGEATTEPVWLKIVLPLSEKK